MCMTTDFYGYLLSYNKSGDGEGEDDQDIMFLKMNADCTYYDADEMS